jgi:hypothetical protein
LAQVVNIESQRMQMDSHRVASSLNAALEYKDNNEETMLKVDITGILQVKSKNFKNNFLFLVNYGLAQATDVTVSNMGAMHFRYSRKFDKRWRSESFIQHQYDQLLKLKSRTLIGSGIRYKLFTSEKLTINLGSLYMYEYEQTLENEAITLHRDHRLSSYCVFNIALPRQLGEIISTTYWQPRLDSWHDFRLANQTNLNIHITKQLDFTTNWVITYDTNPPIDVKKRTLSLNNF